DDATRPPSQPTEWIMKRVISIGVLVAIGLVIVFAFYKMGDNTTNGKELEEQAGQFGADRAQKGQVPFDGKRAMTYLQSICELGPRISGTKQMRKQQELIKKHFEDLKAKVEFQTFKAKQNSVAGEVEMTNIIVSYLPEKKRRVILCTHYDTRP